MNRRKVLANIDQELKDVQWTIDYHRGKLKEAEKARD